MELPPTFNHIYAQDPSPGFEDLGSHKPWGIPTAWSLRCGGWVRRGGLEGEERLANLFSITT